MWTRLRTIDLKHDWQIYFHLNYLFNPIVVGKYSSNGCTKNGSAITALLSVRKQVAVSAGVLAEESWERGCHTWAIPALGFYVGRGVCFMVFSCMKIFKATNDVCHGVLWNTHDCFSTYYEVVVSTSKQFRAGCTDFDPETSQEQPNSWECMERSQTHCKQQISPQVYGGFVDIGPLILMKHFKNKSYAHGERLKSMPTI